ncbi:MAG: integration host factor subunit beta [Treponema sp.]|nr:integration host factor subunit beta [Candidatus Treponema equifaecale]
MAENKITKMDIVENIYGETGFEKRDVQKIVDKFLDELKVSLEKGNTIELRGFGTFEARLRKGRDEARNPKTGEKVSVASHYVAAFRAGRELKKNLLELPVEE